FRFPTNDVRIVSFAAGRAVAAEADDVGIKTVVTGELVNVVVPPGVLRDFLRRVGALPAVHTLGLLAKRLQTLLGGRVGGGGAIVIAKEGQETVDLRARGGDTSAVEISADHARSDQGGEQRDDGHYHQHFDQRHAALAAAAVSS